MFGIDSLINSALNSSAVTSGTFGAVIIAIFVVLAVLAVPIGFVVLVVRALVQDTRSHNRMVAARRTRVEAKIAPANTKLW